MRPPRTIEDIEQELDRIGKQPFRGLPIADQVWLYQAAKTLLALVKPKQGKQS